MISVPVVAGKVELTNSVLNGGAFLNMKPVEGGSDKIFSTQLSGAVEGMSACLAGLEDVRQSMMEGADIVQIEVRSDHTLAVSAVKK